VGNYFGLVDSRRAHFSRGAEQLCTSCGPFFDNILWFRDDGHLVSSFTGTFAGTLVGALAGTLAGALTGTLAGTPASIDTLTAALAAPPAGAFATAEVASTPAFARNWAEGRNYAVGGHQTVRLWNNSIALNSLVT
jgi:hypothetical protein